MVFTQHKSAYTRTNIIWPWLIYMCVHVWIFSKTCVLKWICVEILATLIFFENSFALNWLYLYICDDIVLLFFLLDVSTNSLKICDNANHLYAFKLTSFLSFTLLNCCQLAVIKILEKFYPLADAFSPIWTYLMHN